MALKPCPSCGKEVSDRAKTCPACGAILIEEKNDKNTIIICPDCGHEVPEGVETCPNCGCPLEIEESNTMEEELLQKVEVTSINLPKMKKKARKRLIIVMATIVILICGLLGAKVVKDKKVAEAERIAAEKAAEEAAEAERIAAEKKAKEAEEAAEAERIAAEKAAEEAETYKSNLMMISLYMLSGGSTAETAGNLVKAVWYNSIYEEKDSSTDKYTRPNGYFVDDFNVALGNLFSDSSFKSTINDIRENQDNVAGYMKDMRNPPEGYEEAYDALKECYDAYVSFTNLVINPTGSLQTFSTNFNDADSEFVNKYNVLELYLD